MDIISYSKIRDPQSQNLSSHCVGPCGSALGALTGVNKLNGGKNGI